MLFCSSVCVQFPVARFPFSFSFFIFEMKKMMPRIPSTPRPTVIHGEETGWYSVTRPGNTCRHALHHWIWAWELRAHCAAKGEQSGGGDHTPPTRREEVGGGVTERASSTSDDEFRPSIPSSPKPFASRIRRRQGREMKGSKRRAETKSSQLGTLHHRLRDALNLCTRYRDGSRTRWECRDIETQRHVLRSIVAFLDCVSEEASSNPLLKDSAEDIVGSLVGILHQKSEATTGIAADAVCKLAGVLATSILQPYLPDLVHPLSSLSISHQLQVAIPSSRALSVLLSNLSKKKENEVWEVLDKEYITTHLIKNILDFSASTSSNVYFEEMLALLAIILLRWPQSRYQVWSNASFMNMLEDFCVNPDPSLGVALLKLYSAIALCSYGAKKILEHGETIVSAMVRFMDSSNPLSVRIEGFKLAQCLMLTEQGCSRVVSMFCEPLVEAIVSAMNEWKLKEGKGANDQIPLMIEACRLAMITRWPGKHHLYFWKKGIDKVLADILMPNFFGKYPSYHTYPLEEQIAIARENLIDNPVLVLRPYVWDILGWLAMRYAEDHDPKFSENKAHFDVLTVAACVAFEDIIGRGNQLCHDDVISTFRSESAARVVLMMISSSCNYISSKARSMLCEVLNPNGERYLKQLLYTLKSPSYGVNLGMPNLVHVVISLIGLTCFLALPHYQGFIVESSKTLLSYMMGRSSASFCIPRSNYALHLKSNLPGRACCFFHPEEWEGKDVILFHNLWGLSVSIHHSGSKSKCSIMAGLQTENVRTELVNKLLEICKDSSNCGARWFALYILTYFSYFGFPSELGVKIGKALNNEDNADIELILADGTSFCVHGVLLMVRCPSLLPPEQLFDGRTIDDSSSAANDSDNWRRKFRKEIRLSSHVNRLELEKLLEYVYSGYVQVEEDSVKKLKILARRCGLHHLSGLLSRRIPEWATEIPSFDLKPALRQGRHTFWDIILESKASELSWTCSICSLSVPHMHVHRIILWASCDYLQALLQSGMQESQSQILKVPVSWEALVKLVSWFYSSELPEPPSGCLWSNMGTKEKLHQLELYVELSWLADFWLLEYVQEACFRIVDNGLCSTRHLSVRILQMAANLSQWKLAEAAANHVAPSYRQLRQSGELDELDETLIEMVRVASVRLSQSRGE